MKYERKEREEIISKERKKVEKGTKKEEINKQRKTERKT